MSDTWPIGERATLRDGTIVEVVKEDMEGGCHGCYFNTTCPDCQAPFFLGECMPYFRDDRIGIIYKKIDTQEQ